MQALDELGLDAEACEQLGIRVFKVGVIWPLEAATVQEFANGLEEILVVEEKRQLIEYQLKEELYNWPDGKRPRVYGKFDEKDGRGGEWAMPQGQWLLPAMNELSPALIAKAIGARLLNAGQYASRFGGALPAEIRRRIEERLEILAARERMLATPHLLVSRQPTFCSGCPHNTSTHVPEGSRAVAGIGCHYMATWMPERRTMTFTQMGGEGVPWIGQAPFVGEKHLFANLGDGTYFHSGLLAIRASIAAGVNITYKILYNDAVAMTGGQPIDGQLTVPMIVQQLSGEGAKRIVIVTDEPDKYDAASTDEGGTGAPAGSRVGGRPAALDGIEIHHRDHLDWVQRQLREVPGCTVLIYDQTCASEKRRRRKRIVDGKPGFPDPARRVVINARVCEGCGDCSVQSSCVSVEPLETPYGRKRTINQSSCNKDYSCLKGFCPSFVTVEGGALRKGATPSAAAPDGGSSAAPAALQPALQPALAARPLPPPLPSLPAPQPVEIDASGNRTYGILITGVGGSGVVTIGQLLGMAAHLEGRGVSVLDMAGLAQKGGAVFSHVQIARTAADLHSTRIPTGEADLVLGCDLVVSAGNEALSKMRPGVTRAVVNGNVAPTSDFLRDPDWQLPASALRKNIVDAAGAQDIDFIDATDLAVGLLGDAIFTNPLVLGYAYQKGWLPLSAMALERAIELNATQVERNREAFVWGRRVAVDPDAVMQIVRPAAGPRAQVIELKRKPGTVRSEADLQALIERSAAELTRYQSARYAKRYLKRVDRVRQVEADRIGVNGRMKLTEAVARHYFKLLAYKDEYEVARLHGDPAFVAAIAAQFEGDYTLRFHLAPPLLTRVDPKTGLPVKRTYGAWMLKVFPVLARLKFLRGTPFDPFGRTDERRSERGLIGQYETIVDELLERLDRANHALAVEIAEVPDGIRGYGHVKARTLAASKAREAGLLARFRGGGPGGVGTDANVVELRRA